MSEPLPTPASTVSVAPKPTLPVLIVDDDLAIVDMLRAVLHEEGFAVVSASNGEDALVVLERTMVAVIVTDFMMPVLSGLDLADRVHRDARTAAIPVILMSAAPPPEVGTHVAALLIKPFTLEAFLGLVQQFLPQ